MDPLLPVLDGGIDDGNEGVDGDCTAGVAAQAVIRAARPDNNPARSAGSMNPVDLVMFIAR